MKKRLLLASDDAAALERIAALLASEDFVLVRATSLGEDTVATAKEMLPDAIVLAGAPAAVHDAYRVLRRDADLARVAVVGRAPAPEAASGLLPPRGSRDAFVPPADDARLRDVVLDRVQKRRRILVADDEPLLRRMYESYLRGEGYEVVAASDGSEAIDRARAEPPDLVITDVKMPRADGYEVCRALKEAEDTRHVPVLIVSALAGEIDVNRGFQAGANEYLTKPIDLEELRERIDSIFRGIETRGRETVLVVVADGVERSALEYGLSQQGFEAIGASSAEEGLVLARELSPSVVIADAPLPTMEPGELRRKLKENPRTRDCALVFLAGKSLRREKSRRADLTANAVLWKPYSLDRLVMSIERILGERRVKAASEVEMVLEMISSLARALEAKDAYTRGHSDNVARLSRLCAKEMGLSKDDVLDVQLGAQLHDIGKIGIRDSVLLKPDKLDELEYKVIQAHPTIGADIMQPIARLKKIVPMVRHHHERWDGGGYPARIAAHEIPLGARIIAVADTFDSCTSHRPYRRGMEQSRAFAILRECEKKQLDAEVVRVFCSLEERLKSPFAIRELAEEEAHDQLHHVGPGGHVHDQDGIAPDGHKHKPRHAHPHPHPGPAAR